MKLSQCFFLHIETFIQYKSDLEAWNLCTLCTYITPKEVKFIFSIIRSNSEKAPFLCDLTKALILFWSCKRERPLCKALWLSNNFCRHGLSIGKLGGNRTVQGLVPHKRGKKMSMWKKIYIPPKHFQKRPRVWPQKFLAPPHPSLRPRFIIRPLSP